MSDKKVIGYVCGFACDYQRWEKVFKNLHKDVYRVVRICKVDATLGLEFDIIYLGRGWDRVLSITDIAVCLKKDGIIKVGKA